MSGATELRRAPAISIATRTIAPRRFLLRSLASVIVDALDKLTPANPSDLATALAFALHYQGRKCIHNADEIVTEIVRQAALRSTWIGPAESAVEQPESTRRRPSRSAL